MESELHRLCVHLAEFQHSHHLVVNGASGDNRQASSLLVSGRVVLMTLNIDRE